MLAATPAKGSTDAEGVELVVKLELVVVLPVSFAGSRAYNLLSLAMYLGSRVGHVVAERPP